MPEADISHFGNSLVSQAITRESCQRAGRVTRRRQSHGYRGASGDNLHVVGEPSLLSSRAHLIDVSLMAVSSAYIPLDSLFEGGVADNIFAERGDQQANAL